MAETARDLARKGAAAQPALADRMERAADLVDAGAVLLLADGTARVIGGHVERAHVRFDLNGRAPDAAITELKKMTQRAVTYDGRSITVWK